MGGRTCILLAVLLIPALMPVRAFALGQAEKGGCSIEAIGSVRLTTAYLKYPDIPEFYSGEDDALMAGVVRLMLDGSLGARLGYEVNLYADTSRMSSMAGSGAFATAASFESPYRSKYLSYDYVESDTVKGRLGVDRLALSLDVDCVSLTVGRFPVNYSITRIFTPNDFFAPFSATSINKIYKPGVDALTLGVALGMLSSVEVAGVMGCDSGGAADWGRSALLLRAGTVLWNFEWAVLAGKVAGRWIAGGSLQGEAGLFGIHAEGHAGFPDFDGDGELDDVDGDGGSRDDIHGRLAAGIDLMFTWHNVAVGAEYMFLSGGALRPDKYPQRSTRFFPDDVPFLGRHYVGISAGGEIIPILRLQTMALFNVQDASGLGMVSLVYSAADEIDILFGVLAPWGDEPAHDLLDPGRFPELKSEFGLMPLMVFLEGRFYF